jgi:unsaturated chondroitin disaccharide hydrolase
MTVKGNNFWQPPSFDAPAAWEKIRTKVAAEHARVGANVPYIPENGFYRDKLGSDLFWWTNGFWPGILWLLYYGTKDSRYLETAREVEDRLDKALDGYEGLHHDVGFQWDISAVLDYRLTGNGRSKVRGLHAASLLAGRYNPRGRFIRAWNGDRTGWIIIDCMMNLPLLYWASEETGDPRFKFIAIEHADTTLKYLVREDGSCAHIAALNPEDGSLMGFPDGQGYSPESSWTRGQAWALYGFALSALRTGDAKYLNVSKRTAHYFVSSAARTGYVCPVDFRAPDTPEKLDTSAAMIAACGLLQLSYMTGQEEAKYYHDAALRLLAEAAERFSDWDPSRDSIIQKCSSRYHGENEQSDTSLIYADFFFIEAVTRLLHADFVPW